MLLIFCRSFLDELKACVTSDDIEGIVCLTAVMHIILVINKGWLNFLFYCLGYNQAEGARGLGKHGR